jgi:2'-5' RNA ligase
MYKIAAFINFNRTIEKIILSQKRKVKNYFGEQIYHDHPVHLTLFTIKIKKISDLRKIYNEVKVNKKDINLKLQIDHTGIFPNDPLTKGHTLFYGLKNNILLQKIQNKHLKFINKKIYVSKKDIKNIKNQILKKNHKKYGFPFAGKIWIPHITVASIRKVNQDHIFIKKFLKLKINLRSLIKNIEFYRVSNEKHYFLFKTNIN